MAGDFAKVCLPKGLACTLQQTAWEYTWWAHCKGFRNADLQRIEMGQSTKLTPIVSLLHRTF